MPTPKKQPLQAVINVISDALSDLSIEDQVRALRLAAGALDIEEELAADLGVKAPKKPVAQPGTVAAPPAEIRPLGGTTSPSRGRDRDADDDGFADTIRRMQRSQRPQLSTDACHWPMGQTIA